MPRLSIGHGARALRRVLHRVNPLLHLLFPAPCLACGGPIRGAGLGGACLACWTRLDALHEPLCRGCAAPLPVSPTTQTAGSGRCTTCTRRPSGLEEAIACVAYDRAARRLLLAAKLAGRLELFEPMALQLASRLRDPVAAWAPDAVVPVPSPFPRRIYRGFSPAGSLGRIVAAELSLPLRSSWLRALSRRQGPAKRLGRQERIQRLEGAFAASRGCRGRRVLLVDDVVTTASTARACAGALLSAGASVVFGGFWARTLPENPGAGV